MKTLSRLLVTLAIPAAVASAHSLSPDAERQLNGSIARVEIVNRDTGEVLPIYRHGGRNYVAGTPGERYSVRVVNRSPGRILTVVSVDGVNAVSGETAAPGQTGYVLSPWASYDVRGWRKSTSEVAAFYFTSLPDSYAARTDRPDNVGVIGVALFRERVAHVPTPRPSLPRSQRDEQGPVGSGASSEPARPAPSPSTAAPGAAPLRKAPAEQGSAADTARSNTSEKIGTGHGQREASSVTYTDFERATRTPAEMLTVHYDTRANLIARGIIGSGPQYGTPDPFPAGRFAADPKG